MSLAPVLGALGARYATRCLSESCLSESCLTEASSGITFKGYARLCLTEARVPSFNGEKADLKPAITYFTCIFYVIPFFSPLKSGTRASLRHESVTTFTLFEQFGICRVLISRSSIACLRTLVGCVARQTLPYYIPMQVHRLYTLYDSRLLSIRQQNPNFFKLSLCCTVLHSYPP